MSSLDFWKQVKEARNLLKKNKAENYQTLTISDDIFNMLYKDAERKEKLEKAIKIIKENYAIDIEKVVDGGYITICGKGSEFYGGTYLTETEFNLLKEMLE